MVSLNPSGCPPNNLQSPRPPSTQTPSRSRHRIMFILSRTFEESDTCPPNHPACIPTAKFDAASEQETSSNEGITETNAATVTTGADGSVPPGAHRFIGVVIVSGIILIWFLLWLAFGKSPRRKMREWSSCCCRKKNGHGEVKKGGIVNSRKKAKKTGPNNTEKQSQTKESGETSPQLDAELGYMADWEIGQVIDCDEVRVC